MCTGLAENGCRACASAGQAIFNWNFDAAGKFLGTSFQGMADPPLQYQPEVK
jgi:hypothetical protein